MESLSSPKIIVGVHCGKLRTKGMYIQPIVVDHVARSVIVVRNVLVHLRRDVEVVHGVLGRQEGRREVVVALHDQNFEIGIFDHGGAQCRRYVGVAHFKAGAGSVRAVDWPSSS